MNTFDVAGTLRRTPPQRNLARHAENQRDLFVVAWIL
jgi:hypothetical protein